MEKVVFNDYNRKDDLPSNTVDHIKNILDMLKIQTIVTNSISYKQFWYSVRIEILGIHGVGTNGKGITREYALASAYAEFMERLQTGQLIVSSGKKTKLLMGESNYHNFFTNEEKVFNEELLKISCGSNGIAAGNTKNEALVQALCENMERKAIRDIFYCEHLDIGHYNASYFENYNCYRLLKPILECGYEIYVLDCTDHGSIPVLGVLIYDQLNNTYICRIGSDINIDICIQRCITEIFQGKNFDIFFRNHLKHESNNNIAIYNNSFYRNLEYIKFIINGSGYMPPTVLNNILNKKADISNLNIFTSDKLNNKQVLGKIGKILKNNMVDIFIKNFSILGFPTYRVYIPDYSQVFLLPEDEPQRYINVIENLRKYVFANAKNVFEHSYEFLKVFLVIKNMASLVYNFDLARVCGIELGFSAFKDIDLLISLCYLSMGDYVKAYNYVRLYNSHMNYQHSHIYLNLLESQQENNFNEYINYIYLNEKNEDVIFFVKYVELIYSKRISIFNCNPDFCDHCFFQSKCNYKTAQEMINMIFSKEEFYVER